MEYFLTREFLWIHRSFDRMDKRMRWPCSLANMHSIARKSTGVPANAGR